MIETKTAVEAVADRAGSISEPPSATTITTTTIPKRNPSGNSLSSSFLLAHFVCLLISTIIIRSFWEFENASRALAFYGVYHRYGWNQVVHFFGVPGIIWSLLIFMIHVPLPIVGDKSLNYAGFLGLCYNLFYVSIDPLGAVLYAPVLYAMYASAFAIVQKDQTEAAEAGDNNLTKNRADSGPWYGTGKTLKFALLVHVLCWYVQIHLGHKIIEGAQPAVLQSLGGALSVAPLFAFYEGLWFLGINKSLQESTRLLVEEYTQELCAEQGMDAMKVCRSLLLQE